MLVGKLEDGVTKYFADRAGIPNSTMYKNLKEDISGNNLFKYASKILTAYPEINPLWLYSGNGEPFTQGQTRAPLSAQNSYGELVGESISIAVDGSLWAMEYFGPNDGLMPFLESAYPPLAEVFDSERYPNWFELDLLYHLIGLDINALFADHSMDSYRKDVDEKMLHQAFLKIKRDGITIPSSAAPKPRSQAKEEDAENKLEQRLKTALKSATTLEATIKAQENTQKAQEHAIETQKRTIDAQDQVIAMQKETRARLEAELAALQNRNKHLEEKLNAEGPAALPIEASGRVKLD